MFTRINEFDRSCADVYTNLLRLSVFGKYLRWVFQVCFRRFPVGRDSLEVKWIIKVKFLWIKAATAGRFYEWVSVFFKKRKKERLPWVRLRPLGNSTMIFYVYIPQKDENQLRDIT